MTQLRIVAVNDGYVLYDVLDVDTGDIFLNRYNPLEVVLARYGDLATEQLA